MTTKTEELILEQLFKLSERVSYIEKNMATKDDIKNMATKDDLKELEARLEAKMDARFPRRITGTCAKHQRAMTVAIKRARHIALMPYTVE